MARRTHAQDDDPDSQTPYSAPHAALGPQTKAGPVGPWDVQTRTPIQLPSGVEERFAHYLKVRFPRAKGRALQAVVAELSEAFTADRPSLPVSYLNQPPARSAYLAYFHPQQVLRGWSAIAETVVRATPRGLWPTPADRPLRVADLGAGLGAMSQAFLLATRDAPWPEIVLVDHQKAALQDGRALIDVVAATLAPDREPPRVRTAAAQLHEWIARARKEGWQQDVILMGGVWNEWTVPWELVLQDVLSILAPGGVVVIVEPALAEVGRKLMALRETALGATTTLAPCTHGASCPLLALARDWCFTVRSAVLPKLAASLAESLGHQTDLLRYTLWSFSNSTGESIPDTSHGRLVTDPVPEGQIVCTDGRRERLDPRLPPGVRGDLATRAG